MVNLAKVAEGVWEQLNHPETLPISDEQLVLSILAMVDLDEVAEGAPGHLDHPGTILNWFNWEGFFITLHHAGTVLNRFVFKK